MPRISSISTGCKKCGVQSMGVQQKQRTQWGNHYDLDLAKQPINIVSELVGPTKVDQPDYTPHFWSCKVTARRRTRWTASSAPFRPCRVASSTVDSSYHWLAHQWRRATVYANTVPISDCNMQKWSVAKNHIGPKYHVSSIKIQGGEIP